jgi:hypothetical protein
MMSRKVLSGLVPVAAVMAFMAVPSVAQATQVQCGAAQCAANALIRGQGTKAFISQTQTPHTEQKCTASSFQGAVQSARGVHADGHITTATFTGCTVFDQSGTHTIHISTNASAAAPWKVQIQQPDAAGNVTAHILPAAGSSIQFSAQIQEFGFSVATCHFQSTDVQLQGTEQLDTATVEGQFQLHGRQEGLAGLCGTIEPPQANATLGHLTGEVQLETHEATPKAVVVHMTE